MSNNAAWIKVVQGRLEVDGAPTPKAGPGEVIVRNSHVAINPVDWKLQQYNPPQFNLKYPDILGKDLAGEVVEVGKGVSNIKVGQRVIAHARSRFTQDPKYGAFQLYTVANAISTAPIPDSLSLEQGVVLPLSISTAAAGLYQKGYLELPYPTINLKPSGKTILIWGGSSSVGSSTIQLAVASGLEVVSTASSKNIEYVKSLGATHVFDYADSEAAKDIIAFLKGTEFVGAYDAISLPETLASTAEIVHRLGGGKIATVLSNTATLPDDVTALQVSASSIVGNQPEVAEAIWGKYVPAALAAGKLLAKPDPILIKGGLSEVQKALDTLKKGVSAGKVVVEL